jgi:hypothetical protein
MMGIAVEVGKFRAAMRVSSARPTGDPPGHCLSTAHRERAETAIGGRNLRAGHIEAEVKTPPIASRLARTEIRTTFVLGNPNESFGHQLH